MTTTLNRTPAVTSESIAALRASLRGSIIASGDPGYDEARKVYNGMIDKRPRLIARCGDAADVITAVNFCREQGLLLAIRAGGPDVAGVGSFGDSAVTS